MTKNRYFILISLVLLITSFSSCVRNPVTQKRQFFVMSESKEVALGTEYDPQIIAGFGLYEDDDIQQYINDKGNEMAAISHRPHLEYHFRILDSPVVNAFAVPGGYVYFTRGIMAHFNNEAEFAGVLGHEIGHITARHTVVSQRNQMLGQLGLIAGIIAVPELAEFIEPLSGGMGLLFLKFGRDAESQSDLLGVDYSCQIGYDANEMAGFFYTLARKQEVAGVSIPEFLSTHPNPYNRQERVSELADEKITELNLTNPKVGRDSYLMMIDGLAYGEDPRQGFVEDWYFYHPELKFQFPVPTDWQYQNTPQQFTMAPEDGKALMFLTLAQGNSLIDASVNIIQEYNLEVFSQDEMTVGGMPAYTILGQQKAAADSTDQGVQVKVTLIKYGDIIYNITGVAGAVDFGTYLQDFNKTMQSFKVLTDQDKLSRQPDRIRIATVQNDRTLKSFLQSQGIESSRLEEFAILNGMQQTDQLSSGTLIKVLE